MYFKKIYDLFVTLVFSFQGSRLLYHIMLLNKGILFDRDRL